jgi:hypothetical protein
MYRTAWKESRRLAMTSPLPRSTIRHPAGNRVPVAGAAIGTLGCANWRVQSGLFLIISWQADSTTPVSDRGRRLVEACRGRLGSPTAQRSGPRRAGTWRRSRDRSLPAARRCPRTTRHASGRAGPDLDNVVALGHDNKPAPALMGHLMPTHRLEELSGAGQPRRPVARQRVVDHVRPTEPVEGTDRPTRSVCRTPRSRPCCARSRCFRCPSARPFRCFCRLSLSLSDCRQRIARLSHDCAQLPGVRLTVGLRNARHRT